MFSLFASARRSDKVAKKLRRKRRLGMESLEGRNLLAGMTAAPLAIDVPVADRGFEAPAIMGPAAPADFAPSLGVANAAAQSIGDKMGAYLESVKGSRLGSGECADLATEALRVNGGKFIRGDGNTLDYVWSSNMLSKVTGKSGGAVYSNPSAKFKVGDIIQYTDVRFSDGRTAGHHTSVVAAVNSQGRVTAVFEQNIGKLTGSNDAKRYVVRQSLDLSKMTSGHVKVYRPDADVAVAGRYEFTVVNNAASSKTFKVKIGSNESSTTLQKANTKGSYNTMFCNVTGSAKPTITVGSTTLTIQDSAGYEIYTLANGQASIRKLAK